MKKKKILFQTDSALAKTGFGRTAKALLSHLYKTKKYDIVHYSLGLTRNHEARHKTPWKTIGCLPDDPRILQEINRDPAYARQVNYGAYHLDNVIKEEQPDIYFAMQDIWGVDFAIEKKWFNQTTSVIWTTLDSLPILPRAVSLAPKIKNYWIWSNFATEALHELGHKHVKTVHGPVDTSYFKKLKDEDKIALRLRFPKYIPMDAYVVGFVFRNQLRKSVPNLLEGYKLFKENLKEDQPTRLLLHTSFSEGWNIFNLADEYKIPREEIVTTYVCNICKQYAVANFIGEGTECPYCSHKKSFKTTGPGTGVTEKQLNEIYNLMDVYCHPFTSGGQEIPIQEAKLAELITLVTSYSCGEDLCVEDACSLPLEWSEYREHQTNFRKASTHPKSIAHQLMTVYEMEVEKREQMGASARQWTLDNYSAESIGKIVEDFIDDTPHASYDFSIEEDKKDPNAEVPNEEDNAKWLTSMYHEVLKMKHVDENDDGHKYWLQEMENGKKRKEVDAYFRQVAMKENASASKKLQLDEILSKDDENKRLLYVMPGSIGDVFLSTSLFRSIKELYPDYNLYVATMKEYFDILDGNPHVHAVVPYEPQMESLKYLEGGGEHKGWFEIAFVPFICTQMALTYPHNGKDKIAYENLRYEN